MKTFIFQNKITGQTVAIKAQNNLDAMGKLVTKVANSKDWILMGVQG